ncbi:MAG TPA: nuclear transport factor 2 family protein [Actinomycetota bacterium]|nr:nuclear transport factor 2 family protein [Actinomycetota bacterium]
MPDPLTHGDAQDLLAAFKRGWEKRDPDLIMALFGAEAEYREHPFAESLVGANAIRALWNDICASQDHVEFDAERIWLSGTTVLASWHAAYTQQDTAERRRVRGFMTLELGDDRLVRRYRGWPTERAVGTDSTFQREVVTADGR